MERHRLKDDLVFNIGDYWENLDIEAVSFKSLHEAERAAKINNLHFEHIGEDRKPGATGFMKGEIGLWIGTISALRKFLISDFDVLILFEDDIKMMKGATSQITSYVSNLPKNFDTFILYTPSQQNFVYGRKRHLWTYIRKYFLNDDPSRITKIYQHSCLAAYAISRKGARKILESISDEITMPIDWHIFRGHFNSFSFKPHCPKFFSYVEMESTIQTDREVHKNHGNT
jgi:GR25 family glycosyltransferase involved in LPS biosynthesis